MNLLATKVVYEFEMLPCGRSNSPVVFETIILLVLRGLTFHICLCNLDDVIAPGKTFEEELQNHRIIFK